MISFYLLICCVHCFKVKVCRHVDPRVILHLIIEESIGLTAQDLHGHQETLEEASLEIDIKKKLRLVGYNVMCKR